MPDGDDDDDDDPPPSPLKRLPIPDPMAERLPMMPAYDDVLADGRATTFAVGATTFMSTYAPTTTPPAMRSVFAVPFMA
jgi:hypothetical protein